MEHARSSQAALGESAWVRLVTPVLAILWLGELAVPLSQVFQAGQAGQAGQPPTRTALAIIGTTLFVAAYLWVVRDAARARAGVERSSSLIRGWAPPAAMALLAVVLSLGYGLAWLGLFIFASVGSALRLPSRQAAGAIVGLTLVGGAIGLAEGDPLPDLAQGVLLVAGIGAMVGTVDYSIRVTRELRAARAELARLAVEQERLRFARDLHDLLGHSLSLVALKCDLAEQLLPAVSERAQQEIHEAAAVTRKALADVRAAVAGYRRPTLAHELAGAEEMLAAAGIGYHLDGAPLALAPEPEAALAWALREGVTNVIRHSRAQRCVIRLGRDGEYARLEVVDDGRGASSVLGAGGSGLAGLAERLGVAGGSLQASAAPEGGFRLTARVPLAGTAGGEVVGGQPVAEAHP